MLESLGLKQAAMDRDARAIKQIKDILFGYVHASARLTVGKSHLLGVCLSFRLFDDKFPHPSTPDLKGKTGLAFPESPEDLLQRPAPAELTALTHTPARESPEKTVQLGNAAEALVQGNVLVCVLENGELPVRKCEIGTTDVSLTACVVCRTRSACVYDGRAPASVVELSPP